MFTLFKAAPLSLRQIAALIGLMLLSSFASMLMPAILAGMFDIAIPDQSRKTILIFGAVMLVSALFPACFQQVQPVSRQNCQQVLPVGFVRRFLKRCRVFHQLKQTVFRARVFSFDALPMSVRCRCLS